MKKWLPQTALLLALHTGFAFAGNVYVRINQAGYLQDAPKIAFFMSSSATNGVAFRVKRAGQIVFTGSVGTSKRWSDNFPFVYKLDFSGVQVPGAYTIEVDGTPPVVSAPFRIDSAGALYKKLIANAVRFYQAQRDGAVVKATILSRKPSHLADSQAFIYKLPVYKNGVLQGALQKTGGPVDVSGGWLDAGDYLKFVETTAYVETVLLVSLRDHPATLAGLREESRFGLDWLLKMWDDANRTLYIQVGLTDGNDKIRSDHDFWRLPEADDRLNVKPGDAAYYVKFRPVFAAAPAGGQISPNLAGRMAAAFALCSQVYRGSDTSLANRCLTNAEHLFDLAKTANVGHLLTTAPYDAYPEVEWHDDLALGAVELFFATSASSLPAGLPHADRMFYLTAAAHWAGAYSRSPQRGGDVMSVYDVGPLAEYELHHALGVAGNPPGLEFTQAAVIQDLQKLLDEGERQAARDAFGLGFPYDAAPLALGQSLMAGFYRELSGSSRYRAHEEQQLGLTLGMNAWGASFVVGAGKTFPRCLHHQVANLSGSLDRKPPLLLGAVVAGPNLYLLDDLTTPGGARACDSDGADTLAPFNSNDVSYHDTVANWPNVEPALDYSAPTILLFARRL